MGSTLEAVLRSRCVQYKPLNAVEVNYVWKLHSESDLGVPLAPSAMDPLFYRIDKETAAGVAASAKEKKKKSADDMDIDDEEKDGEGGGDADAAAIKLHPDDDALLDWKGSMGDTGADDLKRRQERARVAARLALAGKAAPPLLSPDRQQAGGSKQQQGAASGGKPSKKAFSRVLNEGMQTWMKKTTYLSNDYTRKVHDFKSLAQTKKELAQDLQEKQDEQSKRRTTRHIMDSFVEDPTKLSSGLQHPTKKHLKPKLVVPVLPHVGNWGRAFTHVVADKPPIASTADDIKALDRALVGNVEKRQATARMSCRVFVPTGKDGGDAAAEKEEEVRYHAIQAYDLDVIPLKEDEDAPNTHFCLWVDPEAGVARYLPISSRVQLSSGRPAVPGGDLHNLPVRLVRRRPLSQKEQDDMEERMAEVDRDMAEKHGVETRARPTKRRKTSSAAAADAGEDAGESHIQLGGGGGKAAKDSKDDGDDDGEGDFGDSDSDSDDEELFGGGTQTIVAEG